jgi:hypothetical protein
MPVALRISLELGSELFIKIAEIREEQILCKELHYGAHIIWSVNAPWSGRQHPTPLLIHAPTIDH